MMLSDAPLPAPCGSSSWWIACQVPRGDHRVIPVRVSGFPIPAGSWNHGLIPPHSLDFSLREGLREALFGKHMDDFRHIVMPVFSLLYLLYYRFGLVRSSPFHTGLNHIFTISFWLPCPNLLALVEEREGLFLKKLFPFKTGNFHLNA